MIESLGRRWLGLGLLLAAAAAPAQERPASALAAQTAAPMRWLVHDLPPHFSFVGGKAPRRPEDLGTGELDGFLRLLIARLPQYRHEFVEANAVRFETMVRQQGRPLCSVVHVRTPERLGWLYFTPLHPPMLSRQLHVIVRRDQLARFQSQEPAPGHVLQLAELLQRNDLVGLLGRDRAYGPRIDALLQAQGERAPKTIILSRGQNLLAMLRARRMDYTLEFEVTVNDYLRSSGASQELVKLPIAEGRSTTVSYASCSRTPEGRHQIEAIDVAMRQLAQDPQRDALMRAWQPGSDEQETLALKRFMDERARGGAQIE